MRGQDFRQLFDRSARRITPADAGTSPHGVFVSDFDWDHPRGCGDKMQYPRNLTQNQGSPPRMRGQVLDFIAQGLQIRITPADAGTSLNNPFM